MRVTRKRFRILLLAAIVAAAAVPVGFALSLEPSAAEPGYHTVANHTSSSAAPAAVTLPVLVGDDGAMNGLHTGQDAAKLLLVGTVLFGLAAAVRKAI
jgi:hypothetical protein